MGKLDTVQMIQDVPIVHPIIKYSKDHFIKNTAFTDGRYRVLEEKRSAYSDAEEIQFDDVVGLFFFLNFNKTLLNLKDYSKKVPIAFNYKLLSYS